MNRETVKRKFLQKLIKAEYKKYHGHKKIKLGKVTPLGYLDDSGCNWTISISRDADWEMAADHIRPFIISLRSTYLLNEERHLADEI